MIIKISKVATNNNVSADYMWKKLAEFSNFAWHPEIAASKDVGSTPDGSSNMIGAERIIVNASGHELVETVTAWSEDTKYYACSIDKGAPPFAKEMVIGFQVREDGNSKALVDMIVDIQLKAPFIVLTPLLKFVLGKKLDGFVDGVANPEQ